MLYKTLYSRSSNGRHFVLLVCCVLITQWMTPQALSFVPIYTYLKQNITVSLRVHILHPTSISLYFDRTPTGLGGFRKRLSGTSNDTPSRGVATGGSHFVVVVHVDRARIDHVTRVLYIGGKIFRTYFSATAVV